MKNKTLINFKKYLNERAKKKRKQFTTVRVDTDIYKDIVLIAAINETSINKTVQGIIYASLEDLKAVQ